MPASSSFGELLKELRARAGLTQAALARAAGYETRYVIKLERGERLPPPHTVTALAGALGIEAESDVAKDMYRVAQLRQPPLYALPTTLLPCYGREAVLKVAKRKLETPSIRLLTLKGAPGVGKTRFAVELALLVRQLFADGIIFVDLSAARHVDQALNLIVQAPGIAAQVSNTFETPPIERLAQALYHRRSLLILDNLEQLLALGPQLVRLLGDCRHLKILATSRHELRLGGEHLVSIAPLDCPSATDDWSLSAVRRSPAVLLFEELARQRVASFAVTASNCAAVAAICRDLGGLPLAIRLAASRVGFLTLPALQAQLARPLTALTTGPLDLPARQQSLADALESSYALLSASQQRLFRWLGVFAGNFTLPAVEALIAAGSAAQLAVGAEREALPAPLDTLGALVDHSLVEQRAQEQHIPVYALLGVIREFAASLLRKDPAVRHVYAGYADYLLHRVEEQARSDLDDLYPDLLRALEWALESGASQTAARLAVALLPIWHTRCLWQEGRTWVERVLALETDIPEQVRDQLLRKGGLIARRQGDYQRAEQWLAIYEVRCRMIDDTNGLAFTLNQLGLVASHRGNYREARRYFEDSLALWRMLASAHNVSAVLGNLANLADAEGNYDASISGHQEVLALREHQGDHVGVARTNCNMGMALLHKGALSQAATLFQDCLLSARALNHRNLQTVARCNLGLSLALQGEMDQARSLLRESLRDYFAMGDQRGIAYALEGLACTWRHTDPARVLRLFATAAGLRERLGLPLPGADRELYNPILHSARAALGAHTALAIETSGRLTPAAAAVSDVLAPDPAAFDPDQ